MINVNLYGTIHPVKARTAGRPRCQRSSMGGFLPVPGQTIYGASKTAVKLMTEGLYAELLETNVGVSVIVPGAVATEITSNSGVDVPSMDSVDQSSMRTSPEDAARIILDGIEDDQLHIYVGRDSLTMTS